MLPGLKPFPPTRTVVPGSQQFTSTGTFEVPEYNTLTVIINGSTGGGGGGGYCWATYHSPDPDGGGGGYYTYSYGQGQAGAAGGQSKFNSATPLIANSGGGGYGGYSSAGANGSSGTASGPSGAILTTGGSNRPVGAYGNGTGSGCSGGRGGYGGPGGQATMTWNIGDPGAPVPGETIAVTIGAGGNRATSYTTSGYGNAGVVDISWA